MNKINKFDLISSAGTAAGTALQNYATQNIKDSINNSSIANAVSGNSITDIFNNKDRLAQATQSVRNNTVDFSNYKSNDALLNNWNENIIQDNIEFDGTQAGLNVIGSSIKGASTGAKIGSVIPGIGTAIGGVIGGAAGLISGGINGIQNQFNTEKINRAINLANTNSLNSFYDAADRVSRNNIREDMMNSYEQGGDMTMFNVGGTHEQNPFGGIPQGIGANGKPNLVEEGEVKYKFIDGDKEEYIFPKRYRVSETVLKKANLPTKYKGQSYADIAKSIQKISEESPNNEISKRTSNELLRRLQSANEERVAKAQELKLAKMFDSLPNETKLGLMNQLIGQQGNNVGEMKNGGCLVNKYDGENTGEISYEQVPSLLYDDAMFFYDPYTYRAFSKIDANMNPQTFETLSNLNEKNKRQQGQFEVKEKGKEGNAITSTQFSKLRYAPAIGAGIGAITASLQPADYSYARQLENIASNYNPVSFNRISGYQKYTPYDINLQNAKTEAARQGMLRAAQSGNRANQIANMIAINNAVDNQKGMDYLNLAMANDARRREVDAFNNNINIANADIAQKEATMNSSILGSKLSMLAQAAAARDASDTARATNIGTTWTNLFNNIGNVGKDIDSINLTREFIKANPSYITGTLKELFGL
jgi:hypothetical protein